MKKRTSYSIIFTRWTFVLGPVVAGHPAYAGFMNTTTLCEIPCNNFKNLLKQKQENEGNAQ